MFLTYNIKVNYNPLYLIKIKVSEYNYKKAKAKRASKFYNKVKQVENAIMLKVAAFYSYFATILLNK
jgi:hypothetical protein